MRKFNTDLISGVVALGIATIFGLAREPWTPLSSRWPNTILVFIIICGAFLLVRAFIKPERAALFDEGSRVRMVVSVVLLLLWASLIKFAGFFVTSVVVFYVFWWYVSRAARAADGNTGGLGPLAHARAAAVIVLLVGCFYYVFTTFLFVPLPRGLLI